MNYYEINEDTARRAKQMRSFDDYCEGSATWQYRNRCDEAAALAEQVKAERCKTAAQREHIDYLLNRYCKVLAEATNKDNEIGTFCRFCRCNSCPPHIASPLLRLYTTASRTAGLLCLWRRSREPTLTMKWSSCTTT